MTPQPKPRAGVSTDLAPPWVVFLDRGKPVAILPAGRPGEVADVRGVPAATVWAIVEAANQPIRDASVSMVALAEQLLALNAKLDVKPVTPKPPARKRGGRK